MNKISYLDYSEDITHGNGQFVLVVGCVSTSIDGITWSEPQYIGLYGSLSISFYCIAYSYNKFVIGGYAGHITTSYDGHTREPLTQINNNSIYDILDI